MNKTSILVTGGSGFIGRNIVESLSDQYSISAPTHAQLDLLDSAAVDDHFRRQRYDVVIHGAIKPGHRNAKDPANELLNNCQMFFNIARNADRYSKLIYLGSGQVYDQRHYQPGMKEEYFDQHVPADEGGLSKYIAAKYIERAENCLELRLFGIFGQYEDYAIRFISNMICKALFGLPLTIKQNRRLDYLYMADLMPVLEHFIGQNGRCKAYNVTTNQPMELIGLAESIKKLSGQDLPIVVARPGMGVEYSGDNARLRGEIKGLKFTPLDESIAKLYKWYSDNIGTIKKEYLLADK